MKTSATTAVTPTDIDDATYEILSEANMLQDFDCEACTSIAENDEQIIAIGYNCETDIIERRTYSVEATAQFDDCWDYAREQHYTRDRGTTYEVELVSSEIV